MAGIHADALFVIDSADYIGSTAPSRRHSRSLGTLFQVSSSHSWRRLHGVFEDYLLFIFLSAQFFTSLMSSWSTRGARTSCARFADAVAVSIVKLLGCEWAC